MQGKIGIAFSMALMICCSSLYSQAKPLVKSNPLPSRVPSSANRASDPSTTKKLAFLTHDNEYTLFIGGTHIPNAINGQTLQFEPYELGPFADTFTQQSDAGAFTWGLGLGHRFFISPTNKASHLFDSLALNAQFFHITSFNQTGRVLQFGLAEFENYTYNLRVNNYRFMADADLDFHPIGKLVGFIEGGIGAAATSIAYQSAAIAPVPAPGLVLNKQTNWSFAYQAGAGVKYRVLTHVELSLRYLYANMGRVNSSRYGNTDILAVPLKVTMDTHNFLFGLSYRGDYLEK